jgi:trimeric autotransporter adhesin
VLAVYKYRNRQGTWTRNVDSTDRMTSATFVTTSPTSKCVSRSSPGLQQLPTTSTINAGTSASGSGSSSSTMSTGSKNIRLRSPKGAAAASNSTSSTGNSCKASNASNPSGGSSTCMTATSPNPVQLFPKRLHSNNNHKPSSKKPPWLHLLWWKCIVFPKSVRNSFLLSFLLVLFPISYRTIQRAMIVPSNNYTVRTTSATTDTNTATSTDMIHRTISIASSSTCISSSSSSSSSSSTGSSIQNEDPSCNLEHVIPSSIYQPSQSSSSSLSSSLSSSSLSPLSVIYIGGYNHPVTTADTSKRQRRRRISTTQTASDWDSHATTATQNHDIILDALQRSMYTK